MDLKNFIDEIPDFPKKDISFKDITPLLRNNQIFSEVINKLSVFANKIQAEKIAGIDARGFIFASALSLNTKLPLVLIRKSGKLPKAVFSESYELEYGKNTLCLQVTDILPGERILIIDDLLATGGTIKAATNLINQAKGLVVGVGVLIELEFLHARQKLNNLDIYSLIKY